MQRESTFCAAFKIRWRSREVAHKLCRWQKYLSNFFVRPRFTAFDCVSMKMNNDKNAQSNNLSFKNVCIKWSGAAYTVTTMFDLNYALSHSRLAPTSVAVVRYRKCFEFICNWETKFCCKCKRWTAVALLSLDFFEFIYLSVKLFSLLCSGHCGHQIFDFVLMAW